MVQLLILSGNKAGAQFIASRLPVLIGRAPDADLSLDGPGVWPRHLQIIRQAQGLVCQAQDGALLSVNGTPADQAVLRNGDVISMGAIKIQFGLAPVRQSSLRARECLLWIALALLCLAQVALIRRLVR
ncbi:MAG: FHA domain-containing protein [Verrucomicrobiota bacterium]|jgi:pSer/pThr/pTyr-binding forkhead associated (FHA) protein